MSGRLGEGAAAASRRHLRLGVPSNLPAEASTFVGRRGDLERGVALLAGTRLLTLTGAGGCGKTRVAQRLAALVGGEFADGVWWVELATLTDETLVGEALARILGLPVSGASADDAVLGHVAAAGCLVVLDNCEHVLDGVAELVGRILREAPSVRVLCTSREPVGVDGETTWRVPSLAVPPLSTDPGVVAAFDAARLFVARAVASDPDLVLTAATARAVAQICQRLDGIPLALELAAARVRTVSLDRIVVGLDDRFRLLTSGTRTAAARHRTLRASVEWSHALLEEPERILLCRLGVFVGGFTAEAADHVASGGPVGLFDVLGLLSRLVDRSLVHREPSGRYRLLETIRAFALERLAEAGEFGVIADRHLGWVTDLAEAHETRLLRVHVSALDAMEQELPNLRAALAHAASGAGESTGLRLIAALPFFWGMRSYAAEGMTWATLVMAAASDAPVVMRARVRWAAAFTRFYSGTDFAGAGEEAGVALAEATEAGDAQTQGRCLQIITLIQGLFDPSAARSSAAAGLELARTAGDRWNECTLLGLIAFSHTVQFHPAAARPFVDRATEIANDIDDRGQQFWTLYGSGVAAAAGGAFDDARNAYTRGLEVSRRIGDPVRETYAVAGLMTVEIAVGRWHALALLADGMGRSQRPLDAVVHAHLIPAIREIAAFAERPVEAANALARTGEFLLGAVDPTSGQRLMVQGATALHSVGEVDAATRAATAALAAAERRGSAMVGPCRVLLARIARDTGDQVAGPGAAERLIHQDLAATAAAGLLADVPDALEVLGGLAIDAGSTAEGVRLLAAAARLDTVTTRHRWFADRAARDVARAADALGEAFDPIWQEGGAMDVTGAIAYARRARGERGRPDHGWDSLTPTELDVVGFVSAGLSNPQVAQRMFIARSTVKTHLLHIFAKLVVTAGSLPRVSAAQLHAGRTAGQPEYNPVRGLPAGTPSEKLDPPIPPTNLRRQPLGVTNRTELAAQALLRRNTMS
ncbi:helix-turn-helix transcriptional regulator [Pseudonocardia sp. GCM10023141]|uniref:helix-turn-helix transcriptional regulator n=1 Tax=Pseudonocardia sp. GCM10023141 TaxID=3252653 RepID=UPI003617B75A